MDGKIFSERLHEVMDKRGLRPIDLANKSGITKSGISQYLSGKTEAKPENLTRLAEVLNVSLMWLIGKNVPLDGFHTSTYGKTTKRIPILDKIAANKSIFSIENIVSYLEIANDEEVDFGLRVPDDTMINARIQQGNTVFVKQQSKLEDGEIAAVILNDEITIKRIYKHYDMIVLISENTGSTPIRKRHVHIIGKVVGVYSKL